MILIADSGASKTDWRWITKENTIEQHQTLGFNPTYQDLRQLDKEVAQMPSSLLRDDVKQIFYYGAGCGSESNREQIHIVLEKHFDRAEINIHDDMLGVARALCGADPGIACILGTGANSCFYDGETILDNVSALGYILGDEGSGAYFGKILMADYLRNDMPEVIAHRLEKRFQLDRDIILYKVYQEALPGRFLAGFARFIFQNLKEPYCYRLVYDGFSAFFDKNLVGYQQINEVPVHFSGSVAFYFSNVLRQVANDRGIVVKNIVESPIAGLTLFHQKK